MRHKGESEMETNDWRANTFYRHLSRAYMWHEWQCVKCAVRASCAQNNVCATKSMYITDTCLIVGLLLPLIIFFSLLHRLKKKNALHIDKNLRLWSRNLDLTTVQHAGHVFGMCEMTRRSTPERSEGANSVSEAVGDEKKTTNWIERTFSNDMTCGEMTYGRTNKSSTVEPNV